MKVGVGTRTSHVTRTNTTTNANANANANANVTSGTLPKKRIDYNDPKAVPDSWSVGKAPSEPSEETETETKKRPGPQRIAAQKRRRSCMSVAVSPEEEFILRTHAASKGMGFSEWARMVLFRAMGKKIPSRKDEED